MLEWVIWGLFSPFNYHSGGLAEKGDLCKCSKMGVMDTASVTIRDLRSNTEVTLSSNDSNRCSVMHVEGPE